MYMSSIVDQYVNYLSAVRNYSLHTVTGYKADVEQFAAYSHEMGLLDISQSNHQYVRSWIVSLMNDELTAKSLNRKISSLRSFFRWLQRGDRSAKNPMLKIVSQKVPKRLPSYVDEQKMDLVLAGESRSAEQGEQISFEKCRNRLVISMLYHTGMRRSEMIGLHLTDVDFLSKSIKVLGKGNKERLLPLSQELSGELQHYLALRDETFGTDLTNLFLTDKGAPAYPKMIYNIVSNVLKKYNASEKASPHVLRHTFATHLTAHGAELNAVKELLGHSSLAATQIYTHNSIERLKEVYDKSHPKSKIK